MNCLEFRRRLMSDPMHPDEALASHEDACPSCAAFARELRAQEVGLRQVLLNVTPPEGMAERIQLAARFERRAASRRRWYYSAAAAVLLAVGGSMFTLWTTLQERAGLSLAQSVVNHIQDEANHLREAHPVPLARVKYVFDRFGARLTSDIGPVNFAAECLMRQRNGVHLVMSGEMGPITVFFMPGEMADAALAVHSERFDGHIVPTDWGSIAVVGEQGEPLDGLGERLALSVEWPASRAPADLSGLVGGRTVTALHVTQQQDG